MDSLNNNDLKHVSSAGSNRVMSHKRSASSGLGSMTDPRRKSWMVEERSYIKCSPPVRIEKLAEEKLIRKTSVISECYFSNL